MPVKTCIPGSVSHSKYTVKDWSDGYKKRLLTSSKTSFVLDFTRGPGHGAYHAQFLTGKRSDQGGERKE